MADLMKYIIMIENAVVDIEEEVNDQVDIDDNGGPNTAMKVVNELMYIKFAVFKLKEAEKGKDQENETMARGVHDRGQVSTRSDVVTGRESVQRSVPPGKERS